MNFPKKVSSKQCKEREDLRDQVTYLEKKLKTLKDEIKESKNA